MQAPLSGLQASALWARLDNLLAEWKTEHDLEFVFEETDITDASLSEIAMKRVVRKGKIVRKVKVKRKGYKVVRSGNNVKFVRMTQMEKRTRRKAARKAWRVGKAARKVKAQRSLRRSKVRIKSLYGK